MAFLNPARFLQIKPGKTFAGACFMSISSLTNLSLADYLSGGSKAQQGSATGGLASYLGDAGASSLSVPSAVGDTVSLSSTAQSMMTQQSAGSSEAGKGALEYLVGFLRG